MSSKNVNPKYTKDNSNVIKIIYFLITDDYISQISIKKPVATTSNILKVIPNTRNLYESLQDNTFTKMLRTIDDVDDIQLIKDAVTDFLTKKNIYFTPFNWETIESTTYFYCPIFFEILCDIHDVQNAAGKFAGGFERINQRNDRDPFIRTAFGNYEPENDAYINIEFQLDSEKALYEFYKAMTDSIVSIELDAHFKKLKGIIDKSIVDHRRAFLTETTIGGRKKR